MKKQHNKNECTCNINGAETDIGHFLGCPALGLPTVTKQPLPTLDWEKEFEEIFPPFGEIEMQILSGIEPNFTTEERAENNNKRLAMEKYNNKLRVIMDFIRSLLSSRTQKLKEEVEKMKKEKIEGEDGLWAAHYLGYNEALSDILAIINKMEK